MGTRVVSDHRTKIIMKIFSTLPRYATYILFVAGILSTIAFAFVAPVLLLMSKLADNTNWHSLALSIGIWGIGSLMTIAVISFCLAYGFFLTKGTPKNKSLPLE